MLDEDNTRQGFIDHEAFVALRDNRSGVFARSRKASFTVRRAPRRDEALGMARPDPGIGRFDYRPIDTRGEPDRPRSKEGSRKYVNGIFTSPANFSRTNSMRLRGFIQLICKTIRSP
jgi:hypothetical protein